MKGRTSRWQNILNSILFAGIFTLFVLYWQLERAQEFPSVPARPQQSGLTAQQNGNSSLSRSGRQLPSYDLIVLILATGSRDDIDRMKAALGTWLNWSCPVTQIPQVTFLHMIVLCEGDPGVQDAKVIPGVVVLPCKHGYKTLVTKSNEAYRYIARQFKFRYVLKVDVDTIVNLDCVVNSMANATKVCKSFGMGTWFNAAASKAFDETDGRSVKKYWNPQYIKDTGMRGYAPYMSGWAVLWSADVARFLGMGGLSSEEMPHWRETWTIDDAALGTFILGLDICRLPWQCKVFSDKWPEDFPKHYAYLQGDKHALDITEQYVPLEGFSGPWDDDVPGPGDIQNIQVENLTRCWDLCRQHARCRSFEYSRTSSWRSKDKNCQLATGIKGCNKTYRDFKLYLKLVKPLRAPEGFDGPFDDDVPNDGDLGNIHVKDLETCAARCLELNCTSFEYSPTAAETDRVRNCQLASRATRSGLKFMDFSLFIRKSI